MSVVLNIPALWICLWFWILQGSKYQGSDACGSEYAKALNMPGFRIYQGSKYAPGWEYDRVLNIPLVLICQVSRYASGSEYARVLNMPLVPNMIWLWIYQGSAYTKVLSMSLVLNMLGLWICQGSEYPRVLNIPRFWICLNHSWICLTMPEYSWICWTYRNMREYAYISLNGFYFTYPHFKFTVTIRGQGSRGLGTVNLDKSF